VQDRRSHKSARTRSRSPSKDRDRKDRDSRSHKSSSSRHHRDHRSRSRSPESSRRGTSHRSDKHDKSDRSERHNAPSSSSSRADTTNVAPTAEHVEQARNQLVEIGLAPEVAARRAEEQAALDDEVQRRRERMKAWREAKRLQEEQEQSQANGGSIIPDAAAGLTSAEKITHNGGHEGDSHASKAEGTESDNVDQSDTTSKPHGWNLEDDDEEDDSAQQPDSAAAGTGAEDMALQSPTKMASVDDEDGAAFQKLTATPVKSHAEHAHSQNNSLAHVTAMSLAASVGGTAAADAAAAKQRKTNRLKSSKWDTGDQQETTAGDNVGDMRSRSNSITTATAPASAVPIKAETKPAEEEEIDPLEAFMSSLYNSGDVAEQKTLAIDAPSSNNNQSAKPAAQVITLEDILAGKIPGGAASAGENEEQSPSTPPSPQFAPALANSSNLLPKSPSLHTLVAMNSASFDNLNRGWESDAPEAGAHAMGKPGGPVDDTDSVDDNGEVPWHEMSSAEKKKLRQGSDR
jgi:hypothetical protein